MGNADALGDRAGVVDIASGTAGALAVGCGTVIVELQGNADHVISGVGQKRRRDRRIDTAGHRDHDARVGRTALDVETVRHSPIDSFRPATPLGAAVLTVDTISAEPLIRHFGAGTLLPGGAAKLAYRARDGHSAASGALT